MDEKKIVVRTHPYAKLIINLEKNDYALLNFNKKIFVSKYREVYTNKSVPFYLDLSRCFSEIRMIILRLNNDIMYINRLFEIYLSLDRELTDEETEEYLSLDKYINFFNIDIESLFIWITMFMDKLAKFLHSLIHASGRMPSNKGFNRFLNDLIKYKKEGKIKEKEIGNMIRILNSYITWWNDIKDIRDDYIIHHQRQFLTGVAKGGEIVSGSFGTFKEKGKTISISNEYIDAQLLILKSLLKDLNEFLCENIEALPFKIEI